MCDVLIIDDDPGALDAFEHMLCTHRYNVVAVADADAAFRELTRTTPGMVLVDLHMPRINGIEFLRRLRASNDGPSIPAALVTGDYLIDDETLLAVKALDAKIVFKPLWKEDLVNVVGTLLTNRQARGSTDRIGLSPVQ